MFRALLFVFGALIVGCVVMYFTSGRQRYLLWARGLLLGGLAAGVVFSLVLLIKRLI